MQVVIDIPEAWEKCNIRFIKERIKNGTPLPKKPTNGDMLKAMFPNMVDSCWEHKKYLTDVCGDYTAIEYTENWWNAPYKGGE